MKRGEIYYIKSNYAETGFEQRADRPAVIVSNDKCNEHSAVLEVVFTTTKPKKALPTHVQIRNGRGMGSTVLCEQITSVDIGRFSDYMGRLTEEEMREVDKALCCSLGLRPVELLQATLPAEDDPPLEQEEDRDDTGEDGTIYDELWEECKQLEAKLEVYKNLYNDLLNRLTK